MTLENASPRETTAHTLIGALTQPGNLITLSRLMGVAWLVFMPPGWSSPWLLAALFIYFYWITDFLDGAVARWSGTASRFGESLDLYVDRLCDLMIAIHLISDATTHSPLLWVFVLVRFPADIVVGRIYGGARGIYGRAAIDILGDATRVAAWRRIVLEAAHLSRASYFTDTLFNLQIPYVWVPFAIFVGGYFAFLMLLLSKHAGEAQR